MTVPVPSSLTYAYVADGVTTVFSYPVRFLEANELLVLREAVDGSLTELGYNVDYTVTGAGVPTGGSITTLSVITEGRVLISRRTAAKQLVDLADNARNPAEAVEQQLDRMVMVDQDHDGRIGEIEDKTDAIDQAVIDAGNSASAAATSETNAAQSASNAASSAQAAQGAMSSVVPNIFATKAVAEAYAPAVAPDFIDLAGYTSAADGGGSRYGKEISEPSHTLKFPIIVGGAEVWFGARLSADKVIHAVQAGIVPGASAADITAFLNSAVAIGAREVRFAEDEWLVDAQVKWPVGVRELDWQGGMLVCNTYLGSGKTALYYTDALQPLPSLTTYISPLTEVITFAAPHGLAVGDVIGFRSVAAGSLNNWRTTYYDGQPTIVREVISPTEITVRDMIDPRGPSGVYSSGANTEVFRYPNSSKGLALRRFKAKADLNPFGLVRLEGMTFLEMDDIDCDGGFHTTLSIGLGAYGVSRNLRFNHVSPTSGNQYGIGHDAFSFHKVYGITAYATRHAIAQGNSDGLGALPIRGNKFFGVELGAKDNHALDFGHGNVMDCSVHGGTIQGVGIGGSNNTVDVDLITSASNWLGGNGAIHGTNMHDMNHRVRAGRVVVAGDGTDGGSASANGVISFGGSSAVIGPDTVRGGILDIEIGQVDARNWTTAGAPLTRYRNRGFTGQWGVRQRIGQVIIPSEPDWILADTVSGSNPYLLDIPTPARRHPSGGADGWNAANGGVGTTALAAGGTISRSPIKRTVAHAGATVAAGTQVTISVTGFSGLNVGDSVAFGTDVAINAFTVSARVASATTVNITVANTSGGSLTLAAANWSAYVTKRS